MLKGKALVSLSGGSLQTLFIDKPHRLSQGFSHFGASTEDTGDLHQDAQSGMLSKSVPGTAISRKNLTPLSKQEASFSWSLNVVY